nr:Putative uncharacterized protein [Moritella viscosa]
MGLITDEYVLSVLKLNNYGHKLMLTTQKSDYKKFKKVA